MLVLESCASSWLSSKTYVSDEYLCQISLSRPIKLEKVTEIDDKCTAGFFIELVPLNNLEMWRNMEHDMFATTLQQRRGLQGQARLTGQAG